ncbi:hypothetical protein OIU76_013582, partial [Salix suchowensis]
MISKILIFLFVFHTPASLLRDEINTDLHYTKDGPEGFTTMCLRGWSTSLPPACFTNSAGERKLPWQTHMILTSSPLPYLYRMPSTLLPSGPSPFVNTQGISSIALVPISLPVFSAESSFLKKLSISVLEALHSFSIFLRPGRAQIFLTSSFLRTSCF